MKKYDYIIIGIFVFIGIVGLFLGSRGRLTGDKVIIYSDGAVYGEYTLDNDAQIHIEKENSVNEIVIENHKVFMADANCPNKICINQGSIHNCNESICCAPNNIVVVIEAKTGVEGDFDAITR